MKTKLMIDLLKSFDKESIIKGHDRFGFGIAGVINLDDKVVLMVESEESVPMDSGLNVCHLLSFLTSVDPEKRVYLDDQEALFVLRLKKDHSFIWIETEEDCDLGNEISERFQYAIDHNLDETDMYSDMLDIGINPDVVARHYGEDEAKHMRTYCEEHGLI